MLVREPEIMRMSLVKIYIRQCGYDPGHLQEILCLVCINAFIKKEIRKPQGPLQTVRKQLEEIFLANFVRGMTFVDAYTLDLLCAVDQKIWVKQIAAEPDVTNEKVIEKSGKNKKMITQLTNQVRFIYLHRQSKNWPCFHIAIALKLAFISPWLYILLHEKLRI